MWMKQIVPMYQPSECAANPQYSREQRAMMRKLLDSITDRSWLIEHPFNDPRTGSDTGKCSARN